MTQRQESNNSKKDKLLGMPHGTANNKLRKSIVFKLAGLCNMLECHRCKKQIESVNQLSVEHKEAWQQAIDPVSSFFDLDNIAFSHLVCNIGAAFKPNKYATPEAKVTGQRECWRNSKKRNYSTEKRREKYSSTGY